jgi:hypothetical protein
MDRCGNPQDYQSLSLSESTATRKKELNMIYLGKITVLDFYGWHSPNTCVISYFDMNGNGLGRNVGITFLPLRFWNHLFVYSRRFGSNNRRLSIGLGVLSFFVDFKSSGNSTESEVL